jgi:hypothetical protein
MMQYGVEIDSLSIPDGLEPSNQRCHAIPPLLYMQLVSERFPT